MMRTIDAAFIKAARDGDSATVAQLLDRCADVEAKDNNGFNALTLAAYNGHTETMALLLSRFPEAALVVGPRVFELPQTPVALVHLQAAIRTNVPTFARQRRLLLTHVWRTAWLLHYD